MSTRGKFTEKQRDILLQPIASWRIHELDGQSHVAGWDAIAHLNRLFGFEGWDKTILDLTLVYEHVGNREKNGKTVPAVSVGYRCTLRLTIRDTDGEVVRVIEDAAMGTATNQRDIGDAHDLAVKSAVTYALKRCAKDLGDQFGLSLYNKGQEAACVGQVAVYGGNVEGHEGNVHADGISEGDDGFGSGRGEGTAVPPEPKPDPVPADGEGVGGEQPPPEPEPEPAAEEPKPVREPKPAAKPKAEKPEPTPPEPKAEEPAVDEEVSGDWVQEIAAQSTVDGVKEVWKLIQKSGHLDLLLDDPADEPGPPITLRELMVRRVNEIGDAA